ncbi:MAG: serine/threonine-protein phosphatase [Thermotogae bacterium]|nr:serine/threonine-protein phosphatase [Thermotogota bacterium]
MLRGKFYGITDLGRVRTRNEDAYLINPLTGLFAIADGLGGRKAGDFASNYALEVLDEELQNLLNAGWKPKEALKEAFIRTSSKVYERVTTSLEVRGAMTTLTAMLIREHKWYIAHVGDTRIYLARDGHLYLLTEDDTKAQLMVKRGLISPKEALTHPARNVLVRALGSRSVVKPHTYEGYTAKGDRYLLASDGLYSYFSNEELLEYMMTYEPKPLLELLRDEANERGGEDNLTAVAILITDAPLITTLLAKFQSITLRRLV